MADLTEKRLKVAIENLFKEPKETMLKDVKMYDDNGWLNAECKWIEIITKKPDGNSRIEK